MTLSEEARDLFYLLADYVFKSYSDMENAIKYYAIDLTILRKKNQGIFSFLLQRE